LYFVDRGVGEIPIKYKILSYEKKKVPTSYKCG